VTLDIEAIKAAAEKATQGEWFVTDEGRKRPRSVTVFHAGDDLNYIATCQDHSCFHEAPRNIENATFIALANPSAVLELIAAIERWRAAQEQSESFAAQNYRWAMEVEAREAGLIAQNAVLREALTNATDIRRICQAAFERLGQDERAKAVGDEIADAEAALSPPTEGVKAGQGEAS
jgi:hypothetical protein